MAQKQGKESSDCTCLPCYGLDAILAPTEGGKNPPFLNRCVLKNMVQLCLGITYSSREPVRRVRLTHTFMAVALTDFAILV